MNGQIEFCFEDISKESIELDWKATERWLFACVDNYDKQLGDLTYIFVSDEYLLKMNQDHLEHDYYTDIITFNYNQDNIISGDLFISIDRIKDNANKNLPEFWKKHNLKVHHSNLCSEIFLPTDENHTLVCCLSSMNLHKFDEWKDTDTVELAIFFLDAVIQEFINKGQHIKGIDDAVRFAKKSRALGLGTLGWHSYLQSKKIPFISIYAIGQTNKIFGLIRKQAELATTKLAELYGEPEWTKGYNRRNLTLMAIAPNRSSSKLAGNLSQGIEPIAANVYVDDDAKGLHIRRNPELIKVLEAKDRNIPEVWDQIIADKGSVINIRCLSEEEKDVFKTFKEINQLELVKQAGIRQQYIDQGQSLNLAFQQDAPAKFINQVHMTAWEVGLKALYYFRSESILKADGGRRDLYDECIMCEG